ncbi:MAG TPA: helix-turn-helix domain-containing protein [Nitrososphaerales archaeon]|nr:helix-turn-helix domain-containing protein [Nitrososphaerales archaeon]
MNPLESITSSKHRLMIGQLISTRPRTLRELAERTGISIQGVLKHLEKLNEMGLLEERTISRPKYLAVRKAYSIKGSSLGDFSRGSLMIVNLSGEREEEALGAAKDVYADLNGMAEELLIQGRRIKDQARRLQRMIDEFSATELRLRRLIESLEIDPEERLIAETVFTEDSLAGAATVLSKFYGCRNPDRAIRDVVAKVRKAG